MAVDTEDKRRSAICIPWYVTTAPLADGTIDDNDRMHATGWYSGIDPGGVVVSDARRRNGLLLNVYP